MTEAVPRMGLSDSAGHLAYHVPISGETKLCKVKKGTETFVVDAILWTRKRLLIGNFHNNCWVTLLKGKPLVKPLTPVSNTPPIFSIKKLKTDQLCLHAAELGEIRITCIMEGEKADIHFSDQKKNKLNFYPKLSENLNKQKGVTLHKFNE